MDVSFHRERHLCCIRLQYGVGCCSVCVCIAVCWNEGLFSSRGVFGVVYTLFFWVTVRCSVLQCVAMKLTFNLKGIVCLHKRAMTVD